jgi:formylglycine-generating enzyme required for sulfatase activity
MPNRREFCRDVAVAGGSLVVASALGHTRPSLAGTSPGRQAQMPVGKNPGEERVIGGLRLCWCPPGRFVMGSPATETSHRPDEMQVEVTLTTGFWMAKFEVTQGEWTRVVGAFPNRPPSNEFGQGDDIPVYWVNHAAAEGFCARATETTRQSGVLPAGWAFRLPTEAQWEYACRAGTTTATAFGDRLGRNHANFAGSPLNGGQGGPAVGRSAPVGRYQANAWNIHDMHGNIFEWCRDWYHPRLPGGVDPDLSHERGTPNRDGSYSRVRRGGAWNDEGWVCRSAMRLRYEPERVSDHIGFRIVAVQI